MKEAKAREEKRREKKGREGEEGSVLSLSSLLSLSYSFDDSRYVMFVNGQSGASHGDRPYGMGSLLGKGISVFGVRDEREREREREKEKEREGEGKRGEGEEKEERV